MFDLTVKPAHQPAEDVPDHRCVRVDVGRRTQLVGDEVLSAVRSGLLDEVDIFDAMGELEDDGEDETHQPGHAHVEPEDRPPRIEQYWDRNRPSEVSDLAELAPSPSAVQATSRLSHRYCEKAP